MGLHVVIYGLWDITGSLLDSLHYRSLRWWNADFTRTLSHSYSFSHSPSFSLSVSPSALPQSTGKRQVALSTLGAMWHSMSLLWLKHLFLILKFCLNMQEYASFSGVRLKIQSRHALKSEPFTVSIQLCVHRFKVCMCKCNPYLYCIVITHYDSEFSISVFGNYVITNVISFN